MTLFLSALMFRHIDSVQLAPLFTDGCVLQRNVPVKIWGRSTAGQKISVRIDDERPASTTATATGDWEVVLPPHRAGAVHSLSVDASDTIKLSNVVFGEVWICSGQSNMEWPLQAAMEAPTEIPASANSMVRMFNVTKATSDAPQSAVAGGAWMEAGPATSGSFSAVGYFFAKQLQKQLGVPVGMIHTSWGGTRIEAWTSRAVNEKLGLAPQEFVDPVLNSANGKRLLERWKAAGSPTGTFNDPGRSAASAGWENDASSDGWKPARVPGEWSTLGIDELFGIDGGVWFRKEVGVPESWAGKSATLHLGPIDDLDTTFVNGTRVGSIGTETNNWWSVPRNYKLADTVLKPGKNLITVRVWDQTQGGGITGGKPEDMFLEGPDGAKIPLAGTWDYRIENVRPEPIGGNPNVASTLYNAMLWPIKNYTVKGAIWYQGESNSGNPASYQIQLPAMIEDWRATFRNPDLYFYAVQLAPFQNGNSLNTEYAKLREAIAMVRTKTRHADSVVITDIGNEFDIHPRQKGPVGERLARAAAADAYRIAGPSRSPHFVSATVGTDRITVKFAHTGVGLTIHPGMNSGVNIPGYDIVGFQIAAEDKKFVDAEATIMSNDTVMVRSTRIANPKYVRFGFVNFPHVNLWSVDGFPVEPFRTDTD